MDRYENISLSFLFFVLLFHPPTPPVSCSLSLSLSSTLLTNL